MYKIVLDLMERYYEEFDGPLFEKLRFELIPFAKKFFANMSQEEIDLM